METRALIRLGTAVALLAAATVADTNPAAAQPKSPPGATRVFVTIDGTKQGRFKTEGGPQFGDRIPVLRFSYEIVSPRDLSTGQASGKRQHRPVTIIKDWSASSPQFFQAVATNEPLKSVLIEVFRTSPSGAEEVVATVRLTDAAIGRFRTAVSDSTSGDGPAGRLVDQVEFTFKKIEIANPVARTGATDDWFVTQ